MNCGREVTYKIGGVATASMVAAIARLKVFEISFLIDIENLLIKRIITL